MWIEVPVPTIHPSSAVNCTSSKASCYVSTVGRVQWLEALVQVNVGVDQMISKY